MKGVSVNLSTVLVNMQLAYETFIVWLVMNWRNALTAIFLVLLAVAGTFGYQAYRTSCALKAHKAYVNVQRVANGLVAAKKDKSQDEVAFESEQQKSETVIAVGQAFLKDHHSSGFAAVVHGFIARALVSVGKFEEGRLRMHQAAKACSSDDMSQMYAVSAALMDIDSQEGAIRSQGLSSLKKIAQDTASSACDVALYRLGEKYWNEKNYQEARLWWGQLLAVADNKNTALGSEIRSPWVAAAREKLSLIDYK